MPPTYIELAARQIGLPIDGSLLSGVTDDYQRIYDVASFLMEFELELTTEAAPVFQP